MKSIRWRVFTILALVVASVFALLPRSVKQRVYDPQSGKMRDTTASHGDWLRRGGQDACRYADQEIIRRDGALHREAEP